MRCVLADFLRLCKPECLLILFDLHMSEHHIEIPGICFQEQMAPINRILFWILEMKNKCEPFCIFEMCSNVKYLLTEFMKFIIRNFEHFKLIANFVMSFCFAKIQQKFSKLSRSNNREPVSFAWSQTSHKSKFETFKTLNFIRHWNDKRHVIWCYHQIILVFNSNASSLFLFSFFFSRFDSCFVRQTFKIIIIADFNSFLSCCLIIID